jgi:hypothetical protein
MRHEDFCSPEEMAELQAIQKELTGSDEPRLSEKSDKQVKHERAEAILSKAATKAKLKAFNDLLIDMVRGFATKVKNCAHDRGQTANLKVDSFVQVILDKVRTAIMAD